MINDFAQLAYGLEGYKIADEDRSGDPLYFGFVDRNGNWYIMQQNQASGTYRFTRGTGSYTTNWTARAGLSYDYFYNVFNTSI